MRRPAARPEPGRKARRQGGKLRCGQKGRLAHEGRIDRRPGRVKGNGAGLFSPAAFPLPCACADREAPTSPSPRRSEEHTSELQSLMRISYAVFCLKKKRHKSTQTPYKDHKDIKRTQHQ